MLLGDDRLVSVMPVFGVVWIVAATLLGLLIGSALLGILVGIVIAVVVALVVIRYAAEQ